MFEGKAWKTFKMIIFSLLFDIKTWIFSWNPNENDSWYLNIEINLAVLWLCILLFPISEKWDFFNLIFWKLKLMIFHIVYWCAFRFFQLSFFLFLITTDHKQLCKTKSIYSYICVCLSLVMYAFHAVINLYRRSPNFAVFHGAMWNSSERFNETI